MYFEASHCVTWIYRGVKGVFAGTKKIPSGTFLGIYSGELLTNAEAEQRGKWVFSSWPFFKIKATNDRPPKGNTINSGARTCLTSTFITWGDKRVKNGRLNSSWMPIMPEMYAFSCWNSYMQLTTDDCPFDQFTRFLVSPSFPKDVNPHLTTEYRITHAIPIVA